MAATVGEVGAVREDIPLKQSSKSNEEEAECFGGSKFINLAFAFLTAIITAALLVQIYYGDYQVVPHGSVATDSRECSEVGTFILKSGGNAVDAAVASAFCLAVVNPHTTGLDATGHLLIYDHKIRTNANVVSFAGETEDTFPNLVVGLAYAHKKFGRLSWKDVLKPAVDLARNGFLVPKNLITAIEINHAKNAFGNFIEAGRKYEMPELATTLEQFAEEDLSDLGSVRESFAQQSTFMDYNIYVPATVAKEFLLNLQRIQHANLSNHLSTSHYVYNLGKIIESTYNDLNIAPTSYSDTSSNVAVMDTDDLYVSLITGLHAPFGTGNLTNRGYFTDAKKKLPTSRNRLPVILVDNDYICGRRIVFGANNFVTAAQVLSYLLLRLEKDTVSSIEAPRFDFLSNGEIGVEDTHQPVFSDSDVNYLSSLMKGTSKKIVSMPEPYSGCNLVEKRGDDLNSHSDSRGGGIASRY